MAPLPEIFQRNHRSNHGHPEASGAGYTRRVAEGRTHDEPERGDGSKGVALAIGGIIVAFFATMPFIYLVALYLFLTGYAIVRAIGPGAGRERGHDRGRVRVDHVRVRDRHRRGDPSRRPLVHSEETAEAGLSHRAVPSL